MIASRLSISQVQPMTRPGANYNWNMVNLIPHIFSVIYFTHHTENTFLVHPHKDTIDCHPCSWPFPFVSVAQSDTPYAHHHNGLLQQVLCVSHSEPLAALLMCGDGTNNVGRLKAAHVEGSAAVNIVSSLPRRGKLCVSHPRQPRSGRCFKACQFHCRCRSESCHDVDISSTKGGVGAYKGLYCCQLVWWWQVCSSCIWTNISTCIFLHAWVQMDKTVRSAKGQNILHTHQNNMLAPEVFELVWNHGLILDDTHSGWSQAFPKVWTPQLLSCSTTTNVYHWPSQSHVEHLSTSA